MIADLCLVCALLTNRSVSACSCAHANAHHHACGLPGFVAKYNTKGAAKIVGNTVFQFEAAGLRFKSTNVDWLVVTGTKASFKVKGGPSCMFVNCGAIHSFSCLATTPLLAAHRVKAP